MKVDLNSDLGEGAGHDDEILSLVSSQISRADFTPEIRRQFSILFAPQKKKASRWGRIQVSTIEKILDEPKCRSAPRRFTRSWPIKLGHFTRCAPRQEWT